MDAQQLRGTVLFADSITPARATLVLAVDSTGTVVARTLTSPVGTFAIPLPDEGRYTARVLRIGFRPYDVAAGRLTAAVSPALHIVLRSTAITLPSIAVRTERVCRARSDASQAVYAVWEEARTALQLAEAAASHGALTTEWITYRRQILADSGVVFADDVDEGRGRTPRPFVSVAPESLALGGYRRNRGGLTHFFGPDATVLMSDVFLSGHCFRLQPPSARHPEWVGVEFEPAAQRSGIVDIAGTAWVDRSSAELRLVEFHYTNLPRDITEAGARGRIELTRLPSGEFVINRWHIAMAGAQEIRRTTRDFGMVHVDPVRVVTHANLSGGELRGARIAGLEQYALEPGLLGIALTDPTGTVSIARATVSVAGDAAMIALTDSAGVARLVGLAGGEQLLRITPAALRDVVARPIERRVVIPAPSSTRTIDVPLGEIDLVAAACGADVARRGQAVVAGILRDQFGDLIAFDTLEVKWTRAPSGDEALVTGPRDWPGQRVASDELGRWKACGIPTGSIVALVRLIDGEPPTELTRFLVGPKRQFVRLELTTRSP